MVRRSKRATVAAFAFAMMPGCSAVPVLNFDEEPTDAGDAGKDGAPSNDAGINTCANKQPPPGTVLCCDTVACGGVDCKQSDCDFCSKCDAGALCCMGKNAAKTTCKAFGGTCP